MKDGGAARAWRIRTATHVCLKTTLIEVPGLGVIPFNHILCSNQKIVAKAGDLVLVSYISRRKAIVSTSSGLCELCSYQYEIYNNQVH